MVPHVHGAHVESRSDGYPESWFLAKASNVPKGMATEGTRFRSRYLPSKKVPDDGNKYTDNPGAGDVFFQAAEDEARGQGYAVYRYTNDQETTSLWFHDHALGMTRLNVYAAGAGFWFIRSPTDGELRLAAKDAKGKKQVLPGPPPKVGQDPNGNASIRKQVREVPIVIQDQDFYSNGRLFYSANRVFFDYPNCNDGTTLGSDADHLAYKPKSDVSPIWNPESFFYTMVVNGNTFPKFTVAPERYRLRMLNACDSRTVNLALKIGSTKQSATDLPMYVIGSDQGLLPQAVKLRTGYATKIIPGKPITKETPLPFKQSAMLMGPSERYDIIIDFSSLPDGAEVYMTNTAPDFPYGGFDEDGYAPAEPNTSGQIMKFVVDNSLKKASGDPSTSPYDLVIQGEALKPANSKTTIVRDLSVFEFDSLDVCVKPPPTSGNPCDIQQVKCDSGIIDPLTGFSSYTYGPIHSNLGEGGNLGPGKLTAQRWSDPIHQNPSLGSTEIWEFWNWTQDGHPLHVHLVAYHVVGRYNMKGDLIDGPLPYETGKKDTVVALPGQVTKIQLTFDIAGYYVWHCHILSHEDNDMMLPFCVGRKDIDCPASLF
jgi:FtsP/CotA-like multicopper oxidase with cupredoxin domain